MEDDTKTGNSNETVPAPDPEEIRTAVAVFDWKTYKGEIEAMLETANYEIVRYSPEDSLIVNARREWGQITAEVYISPEGTLHFTLSRPVDQVWSAPVSAGEYSFEVSRSTIETIEIVRALTEQDCLKFQRLLGEVENIGHANWKQLGL